MGAPRSTGANFVLVLGRHQVGQIAWNTPPKGHQSYWKPWWQTKGHLGIPWSK